MFGRTLRVGTKFRNRVKKIKIEYKKRSANIIVQISFFGVMD